MDLDTLTALKFFSRWFAHTEGMIELRSIGEGRPRRAMAMGAGQMEKFMARAHNAGQAIYFGVATRRKGASGGKKEDCFEIAGAHLDHDCKGEDPRAVADRIGQLPAPPSCTILSGGGLHCYWRFSEPLNLESDPPALEEAEKLNRLIVDKTGGDPTAVDISRILRPPGTWNTKRSKPVQVEVLSDPWTDYEPRDLFEIFETLPDAAPLSVGSASPNLANGGPPEPNPFVEFGRLHTPADLEELWSEMAPGNIHATQCRIALSMLNHGEEPERVVSEIVNGTMNRCGDRSWSRDKEIELVTKLVGDGVKKINAEKRQEAPPEREEDWPDPLDLLGDRDLTGAPRLEPGAVPDVMYEFAVKEGERLGVDPVAIAALALATAAACLHDEFEVCIDPVDDHYRQKAILWVAQIGRPGTRKTAALNTVIAPVERIEKRWHRKYKDDLARYDADAKKYKAMSKADREGWEEPEAPAYKRIIVTDATTEALRDILKDDATAPQLKVLSVQDELMSLIAGFDAYKMSKGQDRSRWLQLFEGGRQAVERQGRPIPIEHWAGCLVGNIQPGRLQEEGRHLVTDGFLQRFVLIKAGDLQEKKRAGDTTHHDAWAGTVEELVGMRPNTDNLGDPVPLRGTDVSYQCSEEFGRLSELAIRMAWPEGLQSCISKYTGLFARLCLVMQLTRLAAEETKVSGSIEDATVDMAAKFITDIVMPNHVHTFLREIDPDANSEHIAWIAQYLLSHPGDHISVRDLGRAYRKLRGHPFKIEGVMQHLTDAGWVSEANKRGTRVSWSINPKIYRRFSEIAAQEAQRRRAWVDRITKKGDTERWTKSVNVPSALTTEARH